MTTVNPQPPHVEIEFTDAALTGHGGWSLLGAMARRLGLPEQLSSAVALKQRRRGASDVEMLWSLVVNAEVKMPPSPKQN